MEKELSPNERCYLSLVYHFVSHFDGFYMSKKKIAQLLNVSERTVRNIENNLIQKGFITIEYQNQSVDKNNTEKTVLITQKTISLFDFVDTVSETNSQNDDGKICTPGMKNFPKDGEKFAPHYSIDDKNKRVGSNTTNDFDIFS